MQAEFGILDLSPLVLLVLLAGSGCAARHRPLGEPGADGPGLEGRVAFELLPDPNVTRPALSGRQVLMAPVPLEETLPEYPKQALLHDTAPVTVVLRIIVDELGEVSEVLDSPLDERTSGGQPQAFRDAAAVAVRKWKFNPATLRTLADGEDLNHDGKIDYTVTVDERPVRSYLDLRFTFEVMSGRGRVRVGPSA